MRGAAFRRDVRSSARRDARWLAEKEHRASLRIAVLRERHDHAIFHRSIAPQSGLEVLGINIHPRGGDDDAFLSSLEIQVAFGVERSDIAGAEPSGAAGGPQLTALPVAGGDAVSAHQDFAAFAKLDFAPRENLSDGALPDAERVIDADERSGFRQPVSLNHGIAHAAEKGFRPGGKRRAPREKCPELPSELAVDAAEFPGAPKEFFAFGGAEFRVELLVPSAVCLRLDVALDFPAQGIEHARHGDEQRGALAANGAHNFRGVERFLEDDRGTHQRRNEDPEELAEDVAQRKQIHEAQGMKETLVFQIGLNSALERLEIRENVAVREDHAAGLGGRTGSEHNLGDVIPSQWLVREERSLLRNHAPGCIEDSCRDAHSRTPHTLRQFFQDEHGQRWIENRLGAGGDNQFRAGLFGHAPRKIRRRAIIHRYDDGAAQQTAPERGHPLRAVRSPEQDAVAGANAAFTQLHRKMSGYAGDLGIGPCLAAVTALLHEGDFAPEAEQIVEQFRERCARHKAAAAAGQRLGGDYKPQAAVRRRVLFRRRGTLIAGFRQHSAARR